MASRRPAAKLGGTDKEVLMKALIVYESMYGNTAAVGNAIASSLRSRGLDVETQPVTKVDPGATADIDVLVVGGPTHVHGMSRSSTRKTAAEDDKNTFSEPTLEPGLREWLKRLPTGTSRLAAAFDTRIDKPAILTGSAAKGIGHRLEDRGFRLIVDPESFLVSGQNKLIDGELEHAATWGTEVAERSAAAGAVMRTF
jgi:Flavodoxin